MCKKFKIGCFSESEILIHLKSGDVIRIHNRYPDVSEEIEDLWFMYDFCSLYGFYLDLKLLDSEDDRLDLSLDDIGYLGLISEKDGYSVSNCCFDKKQDAKDALGFAYKNNNLKITLNGKAITEINIRPEIVNFVAFNSHSGKCEDLDQ